MTLKVGDSNKVIRVNAGYDMSSNTELTLTFTKPDLTTVAKTSSDGVVIGSGVTDPDLGILTSNEYVEYPIEASLLDQSGTWYVTLKFSISSTSPVTAYNGQCVAFPVTSVTCG
jgi:hypothetical protein